VTFVEVAGDMRMAKVHVSVMGDETKQNLCLKGLQSSVGYLQKKVGNRIDTRYTPRLQFQLDKGLQNAMSVTRILEEVLPAEQAEEADASEAVAASTDDASSSDGQTASPQDTNPEVNDHV